MNALADRLNDVSVELRSLAGLEQSEELLARVTASAAAIVEDLEIEWVTARQSRNPPFGR